MLSGSAKAKATAAVSALAVAGLIAFAMVSTKDYGADAGNPKSPPTLKGAPQPTPTPVAPGTPLVEKPPPPKPPEPAAELPYTGPPLVAKPPPSKPGEPAEKPLPPAPPVTVIQQRAPRGAADDIQSADTLLQFDTNRDGLVDRNEVDSSEFLRARYSEIDTNRDGRISLDEMRAFDDKQRNK